MEFKILIILILFLLISFIKSFGINKSEYVQTDDNNNYPLVSENSDEGEFKGVITDEEGFKGIIIVE